MTQEEQKAYNRALKTIEACRREGGTRLDLSRLDLVSLPPEIWSLGSLSLLDLGMNRLEELPPEIGKLGSLRTLSLSNNQLGALPPEIGNLGSLMKLDLSDNRLGELPPEIGKLGSLTDLWFDNNQLRELPPEIGKLGNLMQLRLDNNQLEELPPEIGRFGNLMALSLSNNQLEELPSEIGKLGSLTVLYLSNNQLGELPPEIGKLGNLKELFLYGNQLKELPQTIRNLWRLGRLSLDNNQLGKLPSEIGRLGRLTKLWLSNNRLEDLPLEIGDLGLLETLVLEHNELRVLPESLKELKNLKHLTLHGNEALGLPVELLGPTWYESKEGKNPTADPQAILDHYFARLEQGERPLNEVRLVLVGRGGAGKTSVARRLMKGTFDAGEKETPGIALTDWVMRGCKGQPVTAHVWDFAGQVITHSMHRYFLSHRTVYVLVLTQREDSAGEDAEYWLKLIRSYGIERQADGTELGPPVVVALNKWDSAAVKVDRGALRERYPFITGFVETDCQTGRGIKELHDALCDQLEEPRVKKWVRQGYPKDWWKVKEEIRRVQQAKPHISYDEWRVLCDKCGVNKLSDQDKASRDLHMLGVALNYGEDERLRDNTVLSPNWVTRHCYSLIRHAEKHGGELRRAELAAVLGAEPEGEHDPRMHFYLMRLMERFEIAYPLGEEWPPERWLVPLALPDSQPEGVGIFGKAAPADASRLRYTYTSLPPDLIARFIVRTHPLMEAHQQWGSGTVLALNGARALVRAVSKTEVEVTAIGGDKEARRDLAGLCREELLALHRQIRGLDVREKTQVVADGEEVWMNVRTLEQDELKGKKTSGVETDAGTLEVETKRELDEFGTEAGRLPEVGDHLAKIFVNPAEERLHYVKRFSGWKPRLFISYSHKDERLRKVLEFYLEVLKIQGLVHKVWHDRRIQPGMDGDREIQKNLAEADVVIFLTSTASLASGYINQDELRPALERHVKGEAVVVPIILERCDWVDTFAECPPLKKQKDPKRRVPQAYPLDGKPIRSFSPQSDGWHQVAEGLKRLLTDVKAKLGKDRGAGESRDTTLSG